MAPNRQRTQTQFISTTFVGVDAFEVCVCVGGGTAMSKVADWSAHAKYTWCAVFLQFISGMIVLQPMFVDSQRIYVPVLVEGDGLLWGDQLSRVVVRSGLKYQKEDLLFMVSNDTYGTVPFCNSERFPTLSLIWHWTKWWLLLDDLLWIYWHTVSVGRKQAGKGTVRKTGINEDGTVQILTACQLANWAPADKIMMFCAPLSYTFHFSEMPQNHLIATSIWLDVPIYKWAFCLTLQSLLIN